MIWQDIVLGVGNFALLAILAWEVNYPKPRPSPALCGTYGAAVGSFAVVFASFGLWLSATLAGLQALLWLVWLWSDDV